MKKELTRIAPLKAGIILAILQGILALIFIVPIFGLACLFSSTTDSDSQMPGIYELLVILAMPVAYAVFGFILGIVGAALYNLTAKWTGGFEFEVKDVSPLG